MPRLKSLEEKYASQGLVILGIHSPSGAENLKRFLESHKITHPVAVEKKAGKNQRRYLITGYPTYTFLGRDGKVRYADVLAQSLEAAAAALLKEPPPEPGSAKAEPGD